MEKRTLLEIAYDGTDFAGWQVQPDKKTIQGEIERILSELYVNQPIRIHGSGRTDSGVHASRQTATFTPPDHPAIPPENLRTALNNSLPDAIRIRSARIAGSDFHARYSAVGKAYTYVINRGERLPFRDRYSWHLPQCVDTKSMRETAELLTGEHNFSSFVTKSSKIDDPVRRLFAIDIQESDDLLLLTFVGSGFLYKMVRGLTGALAVVGSGSKNSAEIADILESRRSSDNVPPAPARGLFLMKVFYSADDSGNFDFDVAKLGTECSLGFFAGGKQYANENAC
ncbi:MAG: tRNA pseudouridine(38-40) synthase TruA [Kiritimatiellaeota bacterium]|nr:tRNA pseudouridine(38-40) synthase TruA [Kiritimatiellota bacterium]